MANPIEIRLELVNGLRIVGDVAEDDVISSQLGLTGQVMTHPEASTRERAIAIASTALAFRIEKGSGLFVLTDRDGRFWMVRADQIAAAAVLDPDDPAGTRRLGFTPPEYPTRGAG